MESRAKRTRSIIISMCVAAAGAGLWLWRSIEESVPAPSRAPAPDPESAAARPETPLPGGRLPAPPPGADEVQPNPVWDEPLVAGHLAPPPGETATTPEWRRPTFGRSPSRRVRRKQISDLSPAELQKYGSTIQRYQSAWERNIGPLVYTPGHPREGEYRDSVTLDQAVDAQLGYYDEVSPPGYLDRPQLHIRKRLPYRAVNERQRQWVQDDIASSRAFYDWIRDYPEDPNAFPGDFWFPADPSDPDAITRRQGLEDRIREQEGPFFEN